MRMIRRNIKHIYFVDYGPNISFGGPYTYCYNPRSTGTIRKFKLVEVTTEFDGKIEVDGKKIKTATHIKRHRIIETEPHNIPDGTYINVLWQDDIVYLNINNDVCAIRTKGKTDYSIKFKLAVMDGVFYNLDDYGWKNQKNEKD